MKFQKLQELVPCFLELVNVNGTKELPLQRIADELGVPISNIEKVVEIAQSNNLITNDQGIFKITKKGKELLRIHRERYLHDRFIHPRRGIRDFFRRKRGGHSHPRKHEEHRVNDWHSHGLNNSNIRDLRENLKEIQGRIENVIPLTHLHVGEEGIIQFMFGGKGQVQRLADMGLTPGAVITLNKKAPLHGPIEICIRNACLAIGYGIAKRIFIKPKNS